MKRDRIKTLLLAEALICALLALALWLFEGDAFSVAGFPGSAVGQGLSWPPRDALASRWRSRCMPR